MTNITKQCSKCKREFPATSEYFQRTKRTKDGLHVWCKPCKQAYARIQGKKNYQTHKNERLAYAKDHYSKERQSEKSKIYYATHKDISDARTKENNRKTRIEAISAYGGKCACCGEERYEFLAIDHIDGGGRKHRASIPGGHLARWVKRNGYPKGFQILCHNCNMAKAFYGVCPHQK